MSDNGGQEIRIVFGLKEPSETYRTQMGSAVVTLQPRTGLISAAEALQLLSDTMQRLGVPPVFNHEERRSSAKAVLKRAAKKGRWGRLETDALSFRFGIAASSEHCFVNIEEKTGGAAGSWDEWVRPFLYHHGFIQAWISDVEYDYWQNARDPLLYRAAGRGYAHLPMRSNGLPPPLEQMEVDTSRNPGRWLFQNGYVEAVGSVMWLSDQFWARVGVDHKTRLALADWVAVSEPAEGVLRIQVAENCFTDESTAALQDRLRDLLYGDA